MQIKIIPYQTYERKERIRFRNVINSLAADKIVILATHIVTDIAYVAKTVVLMNGGKIVTTGTQEELCSGISGKVWELAVESDKVMDYMSRMRVSNAVSDGSKYTLRIVADECPDGAVSAVPTLEDVCISCAFIISGIICFLCIAFLIYSTIKIKQEAHCGLVSEKLKIRNNYNGDTGETWDFKLTRAY